MEINTGIIHSIQSTNFTNSVHKVSAEVTQIDELWNRRAFLKVEAFNTLEVKKNTTCAMQIKMLLTVFLDSHGLVHHYLEGPL